MCFVHISNPRLDWFQGIFFSGYREWVGCQISSLGGCRWYTGWIFITVCSLFYAVVHDFTNISFAKCLNSLKLRVEDQIYSDTESGWSEAGKIRGIID